MVLGARLLVRSFCIIFGFFHFSENRSCLHSLNLKLVVLILVGTFQNFTSRLAHWNSPYFDVDIQTDCIEFTRLETKLDHGLE